MKYWLGSLFIFCLGLLAIQVLIKEDSLFQIQTVEFDIRGNPDQMAAWKDLNEKVQKILQGYKGRSLMAVALGDIRKKLIQLSDVEDLQIYKSWPQTLKVQYSLPSLRALSPIDRDRFRALSIRGTWIGPLTWAQLPDLPWLRGSWIEKRPELLKEVLGLLNGLPAKGGVTFSRIAEVNYNDLDGFILTLVQTGQQIVFGQSDFEIKAHRTSQVLEYLQTKNLESRVIDANFSKKVLVRLRNQP